MSIWIKIKPDLLPGLIWVHILCKDYQQTIKVAVSKLRVNSLSANAIFCGLMSTFANGLYPNQHVEPNLNPIRLTP